MDEHFRQILWLATKLVEMCNDYKYNLEITMDKEQSIKVLKKEDEINE